MKDDLIDVLMCLLEDDMVEEAEFLLDRETAVAGLGQEGLDGRKISAYFAAPQEGSDTGDADYSPPRPMRKDSLRQFAAREVSRLSPGARGFLLRMEQFGILDTQRREIVIDQAMALEAEEIEMDLIRWVTIMVLHNNPGPETHGALVEEFVFHGVVPRLH